MNSEDRATLKSLNRRTYHETDNYRIWLEDIRDQLVVHVAIYEISPTIFKEIKEKWAELLIDSYFQGYESVFTYTNDNRVIKMIGGATKISMTADGIEVWKWDLS